jgi:hypothetical protein
MEKKSSHTHKSNHCFSSHSTKEKASEGRIKVLPYMIIMFFDSYNEAKYHTQISIGKNKTNKDAPFMCHKTMELDSFFTV